MPGQRKQFLAGLGVPDLDNPIFAASGNAMSVGGVIDSPHLVTLSPQCEKQVAGRDIPHLCGPVFAADNKLFAVRRKNCRGYPKVLRLDASQSFPAGRVPNRRYAKLVTGKNPSAV